MRHLPSRKLQIHQQLIAMSVISYLRFVKWGKKGEGGNEKERERERLGAAVMLPKHFHR